MQSVKRFDPVVCKHPTTGFRVAEDHVCLCAPQRFLGKASPHRAGGVIYLEGKGVGVDEFYFSGLEQGENSQYSFSLESDAELFTVIQRALKTTVVEINAWETCANPSLLLWTRSRPISHTSPAHLSDT